MADVARWKAGAGGLERKDERAGRAALRPWDGLVRPLVLASLALFYAFERIKRRTPPGWQMRDGLRAVFTYQPLLPEEVLPHAGDSLHRRVRARYPAVVHPVRLVLYRDGVPYGIDEGVVTFEKGRLLYEGDATAFALRPEDASLLPDAFAETGRPYFYETRFRYGNLVTRRAWAFDLAAEPSVRVYLYPLAVPGGDPVSRALFAWLVEPPVAEGDALLPPLDPLPGFSSPESLEAPPRLHP